VLRAAAAFAAGRRGGSWQPSTHNGPTASADDRNLPSAARTPSEHHDAAPLQQVWSYQGRTKYSEGGCAKTGRLSPAEQVWRSAPPPRLRRFRSVCCRRPVGRQGLEIELDHAPRRLEMFAGSTTGFRVLRTSPGTRLNCRRHPGGRSRGLNPVPLFAGRTTAGRRGDGQVSTAGARPQSARAV
jgi:hypothetical protein